MSDIPASDTDNVYAPVQAARVRAGLIGLALGDALGVPHEFPRVNRAPFTGELYIRTKHSSRFQGVRVLAAGQVSDDTELTLALARALVDGDGYWCPSRVVSWYMTWANSKTRVHEAVCKKVRPNTDRSACSCARARGRQRCRSRAKQWKLDAMLCASMRGSQEPGGIWS